MVPANLLIGRLGIYRTWIGALALVLIGVMLFSSAHCCVTPITALILIGIGSAFAIIGTFTLTLSRKHTGLFIGITIAVSMTGPSLDRGHGNQ